MTNTNTQTARHYATEDIARAIGNGATSKWQIIALAEALTGETLDEVDAYRPGRIDGYEPAPEGWTVWESNGDTAAIIARHGDERRAIIYGDIWAALSDAYIAAATGLTARDIVKDWDDGKTLDGWDGAEPWGEYTARLIAEIEAEWTPIADEAGVVNWYWLGGRYDNATEY